MNRDAVASTDLAAALRVLEAAGTADRIDRPGLVAALDRLDAEPAGTGAECVARLGLALLGRPSGPAHVDLVERCVQLLARAPDRRALALYRAAVATYAVTPRGDLACALRGRALVALHALEPVEARFVAARLIGEPENAMSGEPARSAIGVLGSGSDDAALVLACGTVLAGDVSLVVAALEAMTDAVPGETFWRLATPHVGDRFPEAVLAITDLVVARRRSDLLAGFADALVEISDPDLMRAVLLSLATAHLDGVEHVFSAVVDRGPSRSRPGVADALEVARIPGRDVLVARLGA